MTKNHNLFFALIGSKVRGRVLAYFLSADRQSAYISQVAAALRLHPSGVLRELRRLERLALLESFSGGYRRYYRLRRNQPVVRLLRQFWKLA